MDGAHRLSMLVGGSMNPTAGECNGCSMGLVWKTERGGAAGLEDTGNG